MMILSSKEHITTPQATVIISNFILAAGILTLPRTSVETVHTPDVWISVLLGGLLAMIAGVIIAKLNKPFPGKTFFQYSQEIVGKWIGGLFSFLIITYFFSVSAFEVRTLTEVTGYFLLESTPKWAIIMPFMWIGLYLILGGINSIARLFEIIFPITVLLFLLLALLSFKLFEIDNLRPVLGMGITPVLKGVKTTALAYTGFEILLLLSAFMKNPNKAAKAVIIGILVPLVFYMITVVMVIGALSVDGVVTRTWPSIDLIRSFELPGLIFERYESFLLVIWIMQIFSTFTITYYASALGLSQLFKKDIHPIMYGLLPFIFICANIPKSTGDLFKFGDMIGNVAFYLFGLLPPLLLIVSKWKVIKHEAKT